MHIYFTFLQATIGWRWIRVSLFTRFNGYVVTVLFYIFCRLFFLLWWMSSHFSRTTKNGALRFSYQPILVCVCVCWFFFHYRNSQFVSSVSSFLRLDSVMLEIFSLLLLYGFFSILSFIWYGILSSYSFIAQCCLALFEYSLAKGPKKKNTTTTTTIEATFIYLLPENFLFLPLHHLKICTPNVFVALSVREWLLFIPYHHHTFKAQPFCSFAHSILFLTEKGNQKGKA